MGRPRGSQNAATIARDRQSALVATLMAIITDANASPEARVSACEMMLRLTRVVG